MNVSEKIGMAALYEQLAEECTELGKAALKMARKLRGDNPTPMTKEEIIKNLNEEIADVMICIDVILEEGQAMSHESVESVMIDKKARWEQRIEDYHKEN